MPLLFRRVISCSLSPNTQSDDVWRAAKTLCMPWVWKKGAEQDFLSRWFMSHFDADIALPFNSGRSALAAILTALGIGRGDDVLLQAFTCVAVPNSVLWGGARPVYVDIDASFNFDVRDAEKKLTPHTRAVIVQHSLGIPADMEKIVAFVRKHNLLLIEDCAHGWAATYKGKQLGSFGDAAFFSFGRDKVLSSVWGGVAIIHKQCSVPDASRLLQRLYDSLALPGYGWIFQQLLHPIAFSIVLATYTSGIGKLILWLLQKVQLLSKPVYPVELSGGRPEGFPARYPNGLAILMVGQIKKLDQYIRERQKNAALYHDQLRSRYPKARLWKGATYLRYPLLVDDPKALLARAKKQGILLGNWYSNTIDPKGTQFDAIGYTKGSCPAAEHAAAHIINLPTRILASEVRAVISVLGVQ